MLRLVFTSCLAVVGVAGFVEAAPLGKGNAQLEQGKQIYAQRCANCHGRALQGASASSLRGKNLLRPFQGRAATAAELEAWNRRAMPANDPGTLSRQESLAVIAYILRTDGQFGSSDALTAQSAARIKLRR